TGLDPRKHELRLIQLALSGHVYVVDACRVDPRILAPVFDGGRMLAGHNLAFDLQFLAKVGLPTPDGEHLFDTQLAAILLAAGTPDGQLVRNRLELVAERHLGVA